MAPHQPEEDAAQWRRRNGIDRVPRVPRDTQHYPHPGLGGTRGYDIIFRRLMVSEMQAGRVVPVNLVRSVQRWIHRIIPFPMTGNTSNHGVCGEYLFLLVMFKFIWPQATYLECIVFIANESSDAKIFNESAVGHALRRLGYTYKVTSTVAYQAFTERNILRRRLFWSRPWPVGIAGTRRCRMIDADEFGLHLNDANRKKRIVAKGTENQKAGEL